MLLRKERIVYSYLEIVIKGSEEANAKKKSFEEKMLALRYFGVVCMEMEVGENCISSIFEQMK